MGIRDFFKKPSSLPQRVLDEHIYERVLAEIESGHRRGGLWLQAIEIARGDEREAKLQYIKLRVRSMKDEIAIAAAAEAHAVEQDFRTERDRLDQLNAHDENGLTPLMRATKSADLRTVQDLLSKGADPLIRDGTFGTSTALSMAKLALARATDDHDRTELNQIVAALSIAESRI